MHTARTMRAPRNVLEQTTGKIQPLKPLKMVPPGGFWAACCYFLQVYGCLLKMLRGSWMLLYIFECTWLLLVLGGFWMGTASLTSGS